MPLPETKEHSAARFELIREHMREQVKQFSGSDDISGVELANQIRLLSNLYDAAVSLKIEDGGISGPRWGLLMRLYGEEKMGNTQGITPTSLSHSQRVSKNTISALLRGLEEQGLIRRELDSADRRIFRIQLTPAGRELVKSTAPAHLIYLNQMASALTLEERNQLNNLLDKLHRALRSAYCVSEKKPDGG
ncbi:MAG TPA: MarR family transcriptional regulator [Anaerolinea sp.]|nr:MarR family transcriptional regulator [Anaerolinea sp.]